MTRHRRRFVPSRLRATLLAPVAILALVAGGLALPSAATASGSLMIDDFLNTPLGERSVQTSNNDGTSALPTVNTDGSGAGVTLHANGNSRVTATLRYSFDAPVNMSAFGQNSQFSVALNSAVRSSVSTGEPDVSGAEAVHVGVRFTDSLGRQSELFTGMGTTESPHVVAFPFYCTSGTTVCFNTTASINLVTAVELIIQSPRNYDAANRSVVSIAQFAATTSGWQPSEPVAVVAPPAVAISALTQPENDGYAYVSPSTETVSFQIDASKNGSPVQAGTTGPGTGLAASDITATTLSGDIALTVRDVIPDASGSRWTVNLSTSRGSGTVRLGLAEGALVDGDGGVSRAAQSGELKIRERVATQINTDSLNLRRGSTTVVNLVTGAPMPTVTLGTGQLPAGMTLRNGQLSGTPTAVEYGAFSLVVGGEQSNVIEFTSTDQLTLPAAHTVTSQTNIAIDTTVSWTGGPESHWPGSGLKLSSSGLPNGISAEFGPGRTVRFTGTPTERGKFVSSIGVGTPTNSDFISVTFEIGQAPDISGPSGTIWVPAGTTRILTFESNAYPLPTGWTTPIIPGLVTQSTTDGILTMTFAPTVPREPILATVSTSNPYGGSIRNFYLGASAPISIDAPESITAERGEHTNLVFPVSGFPAPVVTLSAESDALPAGLAFAQDTNGDVTIT
ncbi:MAG: hypothetical protein ACTJHU_11165, partial [Mycetocola sp.]